MLAVGAAGCGGRDGPVGGHGSSSATMWRGSTHQAMMMAAGAITAAQAMVLVMGLVGVGWRRWRMVAVGGGAARASQ